MPDKYDSHIEKPERITTSKGGSYITPFDLIRSKRGRELIDRYAEMEDRSDAERSIGVKRSTAIKKPDRVS